MSTVQASKIPAKKYTDEEIEEFRTMFNEIDADHSGKLDEKEISGMIEAFDLPSSAAHLVVRLYDEDNDGQIDFNEFTNFLAELEKVAEDESYFQKLMFKLLDTDKSGYLDANEFLEFTKCFTESEITLEDAKKLVSLVDTDGDGKLDFDEAMKIFA